MRYTLNCGQHLIPLTLNFLLTNDIITSDIKEIHALIPSRMNYQGNLSGQYVLNR